MKRSIIIILCCAGIIISCSEPELPTPVPTVQKIFDTSESSVVDGQSIHFDLPSAGVYTLSLIDKNTNQVISREKFKGVSGENAKKIYTKTLSGRYLSIVLSDENKNTIKETKIIIN